jgi:hypothetical protein
LFRYFSAANAIARGVWARSEHGFLVAVVLAVPQISLLGGTVYPAYDQHGHPSQASWGAVVLFPFTLTRPLAYIISNSPNLDMRSEGPSSQFVGLRDASNQ